MARVSIDTEREHRISMEAIADAYDAEEQVLGWYYYLEDKISFPFLSTCITERATSPLQEGNEIEILCMAPESECEHEMFVETPWDRRTLAIPLSQVKPVNQTDGETKEAIADWHYWVSRGYQLQ